MTIRNRLARKLACLLLPLLAVVGLNVQADNHAAPPQMFTEIFGCNYIDGKDRDDLDSATAYYIKQADKAGINTPEAYLWTLMKGNSDYELVWFNIYENMNAFGAQMDAEAASSDMAAVTARYDTVLDCESGVAMMTPIFQREMAEGSGDGNNTTTISSSACMSKMPGASKDLIDHIAGTLGGMGDAAPGFVAMINPITGGGPDYVLFTVNDNTSAYTNFVTQMTGSAEGQSLGRHVNTVADCELSLWTGEQVIGDDG